ncbi:hypothetical protein T02_7304 [Trichinella nativa]|uniref:Uncharacterized protein n=1 Tax=Trichinella nativa TaxID=6335 RepID=A0A0V1KIS7_9BILA|nr:hypothetical protein T02_7304 [Trichinella nativa]
MSKQPITQRVASPKIGKWERNGTLYQLSTKINSYYVTNCLQSIEH